MKNLILMKILLLIAMVLIGMMGQAQSTLVNKTTGIMVESDKSPSELFEELMLIFIVNSMPVVKENAKHGYILTEGVIRNGYRINAFITETETGSKVIFKTLYSTSYIGSHEEIWGNATYYTNALSFKRNVFAQDAMKLANKIANEVDNSKDIVYKL